MPEPAEEAAQDPQALWDSVVAERKAARDGSAAPVAAASPEPVEVPAATPAPAEEPPAASPPPADTTPTAAPPAADATLQQINARFGKLERDMEGRFGSLQAALRASREAPATVSQPAAAPPPAAPIDLSKLKKFPELQRDFPEVAEGVKELLEAELAAIRASAAPTIDVEALRRQLLQEAQAQLQQGLQQQSTRAQEMAALSARHPDWQTIQDATFFNWLPFQDAETQELAKSPRAADAAVVFDRYKEALRANGRLPAAPAAAAVPAASTAPDPRRAALERAAQMPRGNGAAAPVVKSLDQMTDEEFYAAEVARRHRERQQQRRL